MYWQVIQFDEEDETDAPGDVHQFEFNLLAAEVMQQNGQWIGVIVDGDGNETFRATAGEIGQVKTAIKRHLGDQFVKWLAAIV